jgi:hypothetical protein
VIVAQFRLAHACDLNWAYTGDHPDLFETLDSAADVIRASDWHFESTGAPALTQVAHTPEGVRLSWELAPKPGWLLKRTALVRPGVPVRVECGAELTAPSVEAARAVQSIRLCGVRMRTRGFPDYRPATLVIGSRRAVERLFEWPETPLPGHSATLDNGYIQFRLDCAPADDVGRQQLAAQEEGAWAGLYAVPERRGTTWRVKHTLTITGRNQWAGPVIGAGR